MTDNDRSLVPQKTTEVVRQGELSHPLIRRMVSEILTHSNASEFTVAHGRIWDELILLANAFPETEHRLTALVGIAEAKKDTSLFLEALQLLSEHSDPELRIQLMQEVAVAQAKAGFFEEAIFSACQIECEETQIFAFEKIANSQINATMPRDALATIRQIEDTEERNAILIRISSTLQEKGLFASAMEAIADIDDLAHRDDALSSISYNKALAHFYAESLTTAYMIVDNTTCVIALAKIAAMQNDYTLISNLETFTNEIDDDDDYTHAFSSVLQIKSEMQAKEGHLYKALETAKEIPVPNEWAKAFTTIALLTGDPDLLCEAREALLSLSARWDFKTDSLLRSIAKSQMEAKLWGEALSTAKTIAHPAQRASACGRVRLAKIKQDVDTALYEALSLTDSEDRDWFLQHIALTLAERGEIPSAIKTARLVENQYKRDWLLEVLSQMLVTAGLPTIGLDVAREIGSATSRIRAILEIAKNQKSKKLFAEAKSLVQVPDRDLICSWIAIAEASSGFQSEAVLTLKEIRSSREYANAIVNVSRAIV